MYCAVLNGSTVQVLNTSVCAPTDLVLVTAAEYGQATASPFNLTIAEGGVIATSILGVWALAWSYRQLQHVIKGGSPE